MNIGFLIGNRSRTVGKKESSEEGLSTVTGWWVGAEPEEDSAEDEDDRDEVDGVLG